MEYYGKIQCVSYSELVGSGLLSKPNYDKKVRNGLLQVVRKGGNGREALIRYTTLPSKLKEAYDTLNPTADMEVKEQETAVAVYAADSAVRYFKEYEPALDYNRQAAYLLNPQVLNERCKIA